MMLLRGKGQGLEIGCSDRDIATVCADLRARLAAQPEFYRGSHARAIFAESLPSEADVTLLRDCLAEFGIILDGLAVEEPAAHDAGPRNSAVPAPVELPLSDSARSLVANFAGARADLAARRLKRVRSGGARIEAVPSVERPAPAAATSATLYHRGTLRGGQALHHMGNIVVVGDVNPGAELVASGDIVVFGALRGVAHAGAQGDATARVIALELAPTQLRIATVIAAGEEGRARVSAEQAVVQAGRIVIVPHEHAENMPREVVN
jgi:septum site-determining protein MinC